MEKINIEKHPLPPFLPEGAKLLMLGSFPPKRERWKMDFYYPNIQNDMWRVFGHIFFNDKKHFLTEDSKSFREAALRTFLTEKGIAIWDTAMEVRRLKDNASDKYLEVVRPIDLAALLNKIPNCRAIALTGQKATNTLISILKAPEPEVGAFTEILFNGENKLRIYRMPSTSRAYPKPVEDKADSYRAMLIREGILNI